MFRIIASTVIVVCTINHISAKENEARETIEKTFKVSQFDKFIFSVYESDLQINTWSNNEIKLTAEILVSGGDKDDVERLINAFKNPEVTQGSGEIEINSSFVESSISSSFFGFTTNKIKLSTGETITSSTFKANYTIWIPEKIAFKLNSKYNKVKALNLLGKLDFELYNADIEIGDFGDNSTFDFKYSNATIGSGKDVRFDVYDSKLYANDLKKVIINSKYSTITAKSVNLIAIESYTDKITIDNLNGIDIDAKYTTLRANGNSNIGEFILYDCTIDVENFTNIEYDSKYSEFTANKIGTFSIKESYTDSYTINEVNDYLCENAKYNKVRIKTVKSAIFLPDTYDTDFRADKIGPNFTSFKGDFKYGSVSIALDPTLNYKLKFEKTYGEVSYPKAKFASKQISYIELDSKAKLEGSTDPNAKCEISFTTYDTNVTIE
jgi:hypothetical protein